MARVFLLMTLGACGTTDYDVVTLPCPRCTVPAPPPPPGPACGDGVLDEGEGCDDGNLVEGDGCAPDCVDEWQCGDGILDRDESCDDGNRTSGDGCTQDCLVEIPQCGNGVVDPGEACDDGNSLDGDRCTADCEDDAACAECRLAFCAAYGGPYDVREACYAGDPDWVDLCHGLTTCLRGGCAHDPADEVSVNLHECYCGEDVEIASCWTAPGPGACRAQWELAAGSIDPAVVLARLIDPTYPSGAAYWLASCDATFCSEECGP